MVTKQNLSFKIFEDKKKYDHIFENLKKLSNKWNPRRINKAIHKKISLTLNICEQLEKEAIDSLPIYRVRVLKENEGIDESKISSFIYPPRKYCDLGRANRKGQQVFYSASDPHTASFEKEREIIRDKSIVYLSRWRIKDCSDKITMQTLFFGLPEFADEQKQHDSTSMFIPGIQQLFQNMFGQIPEQLKDSFAHCQSLYTDLFTSSDRESYHITSSIVHNTFSYMRKKNADVPIFAYPSVAKKRRAVNFAFRKDFVDKHLHLMGIDKIIVTKLTETELRYTSNSRGILKGKNIEWFDVRVHLEKIYRDTPTVSYDLIPANFKPVETDQLLVNNSCSSKIDVKELFHLKKLDDDYFVNRMEEVAATMPFDKMSEKFDYVAVIPIGGGTYLDGNLTEEGKVNFLGVRFVFSINYEPKQEMS
jgi:hypothetical protein